MSFDVDPKDKHQRFLVFHSESDCLFEIFSEAELDFIIGSEPCCADVTGLPEHEQRFKDEQNKKGL